MLWPLAGACFGVVTMASAQTQNAGLTTMPSDDGEGAAKTRPPRRSATAARLPTYADMRRGWHVPPADGPGLTPEGRTLLVLEILNTEERLELAPVRDDGGWTENDLERANHALRDPRNNQERPIEPRVLDLAYRVQVHFQAKVLRVVSAYRRGVSKHGKGRAIDIVVPGVRDDEVARFARSLGFVGVGLYPRSGFIHLDTRPRSYFWVDPSGPGQKSRMYQVFGKIGEEADTRAVERGEIPPTFNGENQTVSDDVDEQAKEESAKAKARAR
jgi:uncharacterized protein YcbK (DUF882 family)